MLLTDIDRRFKSMSEFRKIITKPGEVIDFETVFEENLYLRTAVPEKEGRIERVEYTTSVYEDGITYPRYCYVYLPYGYDPEDKSKKYNVLYYQHGNSCDPAIFAIGGNKPMIDLLFESGEIEPCIMVSITYYVDPWGKDAERRSTYGWVASFDGSSPEIKGNYYKELVEDIIPTVETRYNTYLTDPSKEGVKVTRDHRAFSGYSRGAMNTWRIFHYDLEYFRWFAPMSCSVRGSKQFGEVITKEEVLDYLTEPVKAHPELPFFIYASNGGKKDLVELTEQMKYIPHDPCFSYGSDPAKNNLYFSLSDYYHTDYLVPYYYWNSLKVIFKGI